MFFYGNNKIVLVLVLIMPNPAQSNLHASLYIFVQYHKQCCLVSITRLIINCKALAQRLSDFEFIFISVTLACLACAWLCDLSDSMIAIFAKCTEFKVKKFACSYYFF